MTLVQSEPKKITIGIQSYSAMQWPCPEGFHVPSTAEFDSLLIVWMGLGWWNADWTNFSRYFKLPLAWSRTSYSWGYSVPANQWTMWEYMVSNIRVVSSTDLRSYTYYIQSSSIGISWSTSGGNWTIRPFKDIPVVPDSWWTKLYWTSIEAWGIFWNSTDWLISLSSNWSTWITMADKNLWATTVWNYWDALSESNCWKYYQWGNNYWFAFTWIIAYSTSQVDAGNYWPWNYYSSSTFINRSSSPYWWDSSYNQNLRWWVTWAQPSSIKSVYIWSTKVRPIYPERSLVYQMNADSSWNLYVPTWWYTVSWSQGVSYGWRISVDGWDAESYSWTWSYQSKITLGWYTAWTNHTIMITPISSYYWWLRAYCWEGVTGRDKVTALLYDGDPIWYTAWPGWTGSHYKYRQFYWCSNLVSIPDKEVILDEMATIWDRFCWWQFAYCRSLTRTLEESLPSSLTTIWQSFRYYQYYTCTNLSEITWWRDLSIWNSYYRQYQFGDCTTNKTVKVLSNVWYSSYDSNNVLNNSYVTSVSVPSAYLSTFQSTGNNPRVWITDSKFVWY